MKKCRKLLVMGMMLVGMNVSAQVSVTYALDSPTFTLAHESTDKFETLDSAYLSVTYRFKYRQTAKVIPCGWKILWICSLAESIMLSSVKICAIWIRRIRNL